jgi:hypothetical protein
VAGPWESVPWGNARIESTGTSMIGSMSLRLFTVRVQPRRIAVAASRASTNVLSQSNQDHRRACATPSSPSRQRTSPRPRACPQIMSLRSSTIAVVPRAQPAGRAQNKKTTRGCGPAWPCCALVSPPVASRRCRPVWLSTSLYTQHNVVCAAQNSTAHANRHARGYCFIKLHRDFSRSNVDYVIHGPGARQSRPND